MAKEKDNRTLADKVTDFIGSGKFVIGQTIFLILYVLCNAWFLVHPFDPFPFILLNLLLSFQAAYTSPLVLMSQSRQAQRDRELMEHIASMGEKTNVMVEKIEKLEEAEMQELERLGTK